jgi:hypothetical protein
MDVRKRQKCSLKDPGEALVWTYDNPVSIHFCVGVFRRGVTMCHLVA